MLFVPALLLPSRLNTFEFLSAVQTNLLAKLQHKSA
jgi:hypothetical protein